MADRKKLIERLNRLSDRLDNLPLDVVHNLSDGAGPPEPYDCEEVIKRLAIEVSYLRLRDKIYGG